MTAIRTLLTKASIYRWEAVAGMLLLGLFSAFHFLAIPYISRQIDKYAEVKKHFTFYKNIDSLSVQYAVLKQKYADLEQKTAAWMQQPSYKESMILDKIYAVADSADISIERIQISDSIITGAIREIPVSITCKGTYGSFGVLVDSMENGIYPSRIRQVSMKNDGKGLGTFSCDLVVMENKAR